MSSFHACCPWKWFDAFFVWSSARDDVICLQAVPLVWFYELELCHSYGLLLALFTCFAYYRSNNAVAMVYGCRLAMLVVLGNGVTPFSFGVQLEMTFCSIKHRADLK